MEWKYLITMLHATGDHILKVPFFSQIGGIKTRHVKKNKDAPVTAYLFGWTEL